jgi:hypothetical protein
MYLWGSSSICIELHYVWLDTAILVKRISLKMRARCKQCLVLFSFRTETDVWVGSTKILKENLKHFLSVCRYDKDIIKAYATVCRLLHGQTYGIKVRDICPWNRPRRPIGLWDVENPIFSTQSVTDGGEVVGLTCSQRFTPKEGSWYLFLLKPESTLGP